MEFNYRFYINLLEYLSIVYRENDNITTSDEQLSIKFKSLKMRRWLCIARRWSKLILEERQKLSKCEETLTLVTRINVLAKLKHFQTYGDK